MRRPGGDERRGETERQGGQPHRCRPARTRAMDVDIHADASSSGLWRKYPGGGSPGEGAQAGVQVSEGVSAADPVPWKPNVVAAPGARAPL
ncbi:hypothetical protein GCM10023191_082390 [Actinoallomurus oryzae]|uniref:Uncharacterized protein n=1 Tax=Actinoallomurus oryzae TaxID=502180 RepID=A0ABP8QZK3_9ACTN